MSLAEPHTRARATGFPVPARSGSGTAKRRILIQLRLMILARRLLGVIFFALHCSMTRNALKRLRQVQRALLVGV